MNKNHLSIRRVLGFFSQLLPTPYSHCYCCGITWNFTEHHTTPYRKGSGMLPLCEWCWSRLTADERLPYYVRLFDRWLKESPDLDVTYAEVVAAVYAEEKSVSLQAADNTIVLYGVNMDRPVTDSERSDICFEIVELMRLRGINARVIATVCKGVEKGAEIEVFYKP